MDKQEVTCLSFAGFDTVANHIFQAGKDFDVIGYIRSEISFLSEQKQVETERYGLHMPTVSNWCPAK